MDFRSLYRHGFVRVAAQTIRTTIADPAANAAAVLAAARECDADGAGLVVFPELTLSGYSIEDVLMQDTLLDAVERELVGLAAASAGLLPVLVVGAPLRHRHRIYNGAVVIHRGRILGVAPKSYLPTYREFYERRQLAPGDDQRGEIRIVKPLAASFLDARGARLLVVDDLVDTGATARVLRELLPHAHLATVYAKPAGRPLVDTFVTEVSQDTWINFPWDLGLAFQPPIARGAD